MESNTTDLRQSLFFTARKAKVPDADADSTASALSSELASSRYYFARIHSMTERTSELDMNKEDAAIEASKSHRTQVESKYESARDSSTSSDSSTISSDLSTTSSESCSGIDQELLEENLEAMRRLQRQHPGNDFFQCEGDWVLGRKIAEGGQAAIYAVEEFVNPNGEKITFAPRVLKVFKAGYSLDDLQEQWALSVIHKLNPSKEHFKDSPGFWNAIFCGRLLGDGRFAFEMPQWWGNLRKLMDVQMQQNGNQCLPLMLPNGNYHDCCMLHTMLDIAMGMWDLHAEGTFH